MQFYSIWPVFAVLLVVLALASTPLFRAADTPPNDTPNRIRAMDGLRGFLALAVVFHHIAFYHEYTLSGAWKPPPSHFALMLGPAGVGMFFMITGYLFWAKVLKERGKPSWLHLYVGRVFRIGPLYVAAALAVLVDVALATHVRAVESLPRLAVECGEWLALGIFVGPAVNGYAPTERLLAGVTWTLAYEWKFYLALLPLSLVTRWRAAVLPFTVASAGGALLVLAMHPGSALKVQTIALFAVGMLCATLHERKLVPAIGNRAASVIVAASIAASAFCPVGSAAQFECLSVAFFLIASECTLFGLLTSRPARRLGDVSYGIYLLQGLALNMAYSFPGMHDRIVTQPLFHWAAGLLACIVLLVLATVAHVAIERPGIALGKRVAAYFDRRSVLVTA